MLTLKELFESDFPNDLKITQDYSAFSEDSSTFFIPRVHINFDAGVRYISIYLPQEQDYFFICKKILESIGGILAYSGKGATITLPPANKYYGSFKFGRDNNDLIDIISHPFSEDIIDSLSLHFSKNVFIYSENEFTENEKNHIIKFARLLDLNLRFRSKNYLNERIKNEIPLAFISYDSNDRKIAQPLAEQLRRLNCSVWYDEYSLKPAQSLRLSIEEGIKKCKRCILILSPNYFANEGWANIEFTSIFNKEVIEKNNIIIPIWYNVEPKDIYNFCPSLVDRIAIKWNDDVVQVSKKIANALDN